MTDFLYNDNSVFLGMPYFLSGKSERSLKEKTSFLKSNVLKKKSSL